ncbi:MAG: hydantoinase B/oxoprolinase family protein, partial [Dehalococcoidia bacterium]
MKSTIDPVTLSTVWHSMQSYCREMRYIIERTAQSLLISQLKDISVGIWDGTGTKTIAIPQGLPGQFVGGKFTIQYLLEDYKDRIYPGDIFLNNDPYHGQANHLPDWAFIRPIFYKDELLFFTMARAHQYDTGGSYPGGYFPNAYDIIAEGLNIPPIKVVERGVEKEDILKLVWNNVRWPEGVRVDNYALIAATEVCSRRLQALLDKYGRDTVLGCVDEMIDRTESLVREEIRKIPDGTYRGESGTDDDGTILDEPVWVRCEVSVKGDEMTIDFSESDEQRPGFINSVYMTTYSSALASVFLFLPASLADYHNEGSMKPITVIAPEGSVVNSKYPATVGASPVTTATQIMESVLMAMSEALEHRAIAPWGRHYSQYIFGPTPRTGIRYV